MKPNTVYEDGTYLENNPTWHEENSAWKARQILRILERNGISPSTVAEVGCGAGGILVSLANVFGPDVQFSGYEISPQALALCKDKEKPNLHFFLQDLLAESTVSFDVLLAIDVIEHVEDCFGFLRRVRARGRYKVFHIPLDLSVQMVLRSSPLLRVREKVGHIHYFTKETALATLRDTGHEIVDHFYTRPSLERPNLGWRVNLLRLPRKLLFSLHPDLTVRILGGFSLLALTR